MTEIKPEQDDTVYRQAAPNPGWPNEIRLLIRFVRPKKARPCAVCQRETKKLWTMLCPFIAHTVDRFVTKPSGELAPLTEVCDDHPIAPTDAIRRAL